MQVDILISNVKHDLVAEIHKYLKNGWELRGELIVTAYPEYGRRAISIHASGDQEVISGF